MRQHPGLTSHNYHHDQETDMSNNDARDARIRELQEQRDSGNDYGPDQARELAALTGTAVRLPGSGSHDRPRDTDEAAGTLTRRQGAS
jgi:hypothetical protein